MSSHRPCVLVALLLVISLGQSLANEYAIETFDYPSHQALADTKAAQGWTSGWMADPDLKQKLPSKYRVISESLVSSAFEQHGLKPQGGKFATPEDTEDLNVSIYRGLDQPIDWSDENDLYLSFLVRWDGNHPSTASRLRLGFAESRENEDQRFKSCYVSLAGTGEANEMRLVVRNSGGTKNGEKIYPAGETYFVIVCFATRSGGEPDRMSAMVFGPDDEVPSDSPSEWEVEVVRPAKGFANTMEFNSNLYLGGRKAHIDEIRFGPSWESVTRGN